MKKSNTPKNIYLNIQILRMIFSFNIVVFHCISRKYINKIIYIFCIVGIKHYVATFFLISFYLSYSKFSQRNIIKLKERILRISIPYFIWPCIFWIKYIIVNYKNKNQLRGKLKVLLYQLIIGKPFHPVFWFQFCLLFWSIIFIIIIFSFKRTYNYILLLLIILILYLNYSGYTNLLLENYTQIIKKSIGDLFYKNIYMYTGFIFGSLAIIDRKFNIKFIIILISVISMLILKILITKKNIDNIFIQLSISIIFISSSFLPFYLIKNNNIIFIIKQITSFTGGIYYIHWEIKYRTLKKFFLIKKYNFVSCIIIYLISYIFCFFFFKIFKNTKLKYLFI